MKVGLKFILKAKRVKIVSKLLTPFRNTKFLSVSWNIAINNLQLTINWKFSARSSLWIAAKGYEGVSECHSLLSLCDRFAWKIKVSLLNFTPEKESTARILPRFNFGKTRTDKRQIICYCGTLFLTHAKQTVACKWTYTVEHWPSQPFRTYSVGPRTHVYQCMLGSLEVCLTKN